MRSLAIGATGMLAQQMNVEVIANNIANVNTTGFKRQRAEFQDLLYQSITRPGSTSSDVNTVVPTGIQLGSGVKAVGIYRMANQGSLQVTDNALDLAIQGEGYFRIELPNGEIAMTRAGSFQTNDAGTLVNAQGFPVQPGIVIPPDAVDIDVNASGEVLVKIEGQEGFANVGQIELAVFPNAAGLDALGDGLFRESPGSGDAIVGPPGVAGAGTLLQGSLEASNVNVVQEITNLISAQRAYEMNSKVIRATDEMMASVNQLR